MKLYNDFVGIDDASCTRYFDTRGEEEAFLKGLETQPADWYYRTANISYITNSYGHRCVDINNLNFDNYILFLGCSHTFGTGLELEKTYPYIVSSKLNMDYYNLAVSATGMDVIEHNLITWLFKFKTKPKAIIIQFPDSTRFLSCHKGYDNLIPNGTWTPDQNVEKQLASSDMAGISVARKFLITSLLEIVTKNIPTLYFAYISQEPIINKCLYFRKLDLARDLGHFGIKSHQKFADSIVEHLPSLY